jgi:hypothetical protein
MAKRLKFVRGADEFVDRGVTLVKGGPGQEVEDDRAEVLENLAGYDFVEESDEEYQERVQAAEELAAAEAAAEEAQADARQAEIDQAQRTADFFNADTVAEQEEKGVASPDSARPATEQGVGSEPEDVEPADVADGAVQEQSSTDESDASTDAQDPDRATRRGSRGRSFE